MHNFVGTCGTTIPRKAVTKRSINGDGRVLCKTVKRPKLVEEYHDRAPALDIHNHLRQDGLVLESAWGTHKWYHRVYVSLLGIIETNAYLAHNYLRCQMCQMQETTHVDFTRALALQLIHSRDHDNKQRQRRERRRRKVHRSKSRRSIDGSTNSDRSQGIA